MGAEDKITIVAGGPIGDLFFAINHYVATADGFGSGMWAPTTPDPKGPGEVVVLVDHRNPDDRDDFARFKARLAEVYPCEWTDEPETQARPGAKLFRAHTFQITLADMPRVAAGLLQKPSALGWGTGKRVADAVPAFVKAREEIIKRGA